LKGLNITDNPTALPIDEAIEALDKAELDTMERYGITRVPAAAYIIGPYRYSKLADAVAEAKRQAA